MVVAQIFMSHCPVPVQKYERVERVGEGSYGVVFKARNTSTQEIVAMKRIRIENNEEGLPATALREIAVLKKVQAHNVVQLHDVVLEHFKESSKLYLVFEFLSQDLKVYIDSIGTQGMDPNIVKLFARQMLNGLAECHSKLIIHRDLKPQNLLIDCKGRLKLADFGLARSFETPLHKYTHEVVTQWYRAPEILLGTDYYSTGVDLWAAGCIVAEMHNLNALLPGDSEIDQLYRIFRVLGTPTEEVWPGCSSLPDFSEHFPTWPAPNSMAKLLPDFPASGVNLVERLVSYVPGNRLTALEAINHPYFVGPGAGIPLEPVQFFDSHAALSPSTTMMSSPSMAPGIR